MLRMLRSGLGTGRKVSAAQQLRQLYYGIADVAIRRSPRGKMTPEQTSTLGAYCDAISVSEARTAIERDVRTAQSTNA